MLFTFKTLSRGLGLVGFSFLMTGHAVGQPNEKESTGLANLAKPAFDNESAASESLPAPFLGRWVTRDDRLQIASTRMVKASLASDVVFRVIASAGQTFTIETGDQAKSDLRLENGELVESRRVGPQVLRIASERYGSDATALEWLRQKPIVTHWKRSVHAESWVERAEEAVDRLTGDGAFRATFAKTFEAVWSTPIKVIDVYTIRDKGFLEVNMLLSIDKRPWVWRFNDAGDVQAGFKHEPFPAIARDYVYLVRPFNTLDVPGPLVDWLHDHAMPRIWSALGPPNVAPQAPLRGLRGLRLFDPVEALLKVCPDAYPDKPDMELTVYTSDTCGAGLLGRGIPVRFGFREGSLRLVWQRLAALPSVQRQEVTKRINDLGGAVCANQEKPEQPAEGSWSCDIQRGAFFALVGQGADVEFRATVLPPKRL